MAHVISFRTGRFDVAAETPNPINPIAGESVLNWLRAELTAIGYEATEPATEDWGWYIDVARDGASYLVGASADAEPSSAEVEWVIQIHKHRSIKDKVLGKNKLLADEPLVALIENIVRADSRISEVAVDRDA